MENTTICNDEFKNDMTGITTLSVLDDASDDFDRLLDEFIRKSLEEDAGDEKNDNDVDDDDDENDEEYDDNEEDGNEDEEEEENDETEFIEFKYGSTCFKLGSCNYEMPKQPHRCKASELILHNDSHEEQCLQGEPVVLVSNEEDSLKLVLTAHSITGFREEYTPVVYIYRAAESYPIERVPLYFDDDERLLRATFNDVVETLPCGNYFFYLWGVEVEGLSTVYKGCNGGCCIPFVKVDGDIELSSVAPEMVSIKADCQHQAIDISLRFEEMLDKRYAYSLFLYNRNFNLVSRGATFAWDTFSSRKRKNLSARLNTAYIPFGEYRLLVTQSGIPCWKVEFSVDGDKACVKDISDIKPFSEEFLVLYELEKDYYWHRLRESDATIEMKEFALSTYKSCYLNKKRSSMGLNALTTPPHFIYNGGSGTTELGALSCMSRMFWNISYFHPIDCVTFADNGTVSGAIDKITEEFSACNNKCVALYNLSALGANASLVAKKMVDAMNRHSALSICLIGSRAEVGQFFESFSQLKNHFLESNCIPSGNVVAETVVGKVIKELKKCDLKLSHQAQQFLVDTARCAESEGCLNGLKTTDIHDFVKKGIVDNFVSRIMTSVNKKSIADKEYLSTVEVCDIDKEKILRKKEDGFEESIRQLNMMIGLDNVKQNITTTFNRLKISADRRRLGLKVKGGECHHMLFTGNPGTGKTTVAKMMGRIYHSLGLLSKGDVIFVDRGKIVGRYIGETESNMQRILQEAKGNILFIDEAYTLCDCVSDRKDFGYRAIECLLTVMAQDDCDMIVIFAGYSKEIEMMMRSNQGLSGRFPYKFEFADYSADELMQIAELKLFQEDYELTGEARELLYNTIEETVRNKEWDFCNARWVGQYVNNGIIPAQSERLMKCTAPITRDDYRMIVAEDVNAAYALHKQTKKSCKIYRGIGFTA